MQQDCTPADTAHHSCSRRHPNARWPPPVSPLPWQAFLEPLPVRALPGIGYKLAQQLAQLGVSTVAHLRQQPLKRLAGALGESTGG